MSDGPYSPNTSKKETVDARPFLEWWDRFVGRRDRIVELGKAYDGVSGGGFAGFGVMHNPQRGHGRATPPIEEFCRLAGVSPRLISRARQTGRITWSAVDKILVAAGGPHLSEMYPELYPDLEESA